MVFFFNDTATTEIYTLSLHDALPICDRSRVEGHAPPRGADPRRAVAARLGGLRRAGDRSDRKSTRLNSSHRTISYAVFCLKKKIEKCHKIARCDGIFISDLPARICVI